MPPASTTSHIRTNTQQHDSTYHCDSIYIREYIRGDTVYLDRWRDRWRERVVIRSDTVYQDKEIIVHSPPEKYVPRIVKWLAYIGATTMILILLCLLWKINGLIYGKLHV